MLPSFIERRLNKRYPCDLAVQFAVYEKDRSVAVTGFVEGRVMDISCDGCRITTAKVYFDSFHLMQSIQNESYFIKINLKKKNGESSDLQGRIIWLNKIFEKEKQPYVFGVKFLSRIDTDNFI